MDSPTENIDSLSGIYGPAQTKSEPAFKAEVPASQRNFFVETFLKGNLLLLIIIFVVIIILSSIFLKRCSQKPKVEAPSQVPQSLISPTAYPTWTPKPAAARPTIFYEKFPFKATDKTRKVEIIGCLADNSDWGLIYPKKTVEIPNNQNPIEETTKAFLLEAATNGWGGFPKKEEVAAYLSYKQKTFPNFTYKYGQVSLVKASLDSKGTATIVFSKEAEAYGGGSSRVACINDSVELTLKQFPEVKNIIMCIENECNDQKGSTIFQP